jgi:hypothetical protein
VFAEGTTLETLDNVDSRRYLLAAVLATLVVIVLPAVVVIQLSPLSGLPDLLLSAVLATGLSVAFGSICSSLWTRRPESREIAFGDLMLWAWARRVRAERRLAKVARDGGDTGERELAALRRLTVVFEARDGFSHGHSGRVARHCERIARRMGLPAAEVEQIEAAAAVHDVGMVRVPRAIASKGADVTSDERGLVERHAVQGAEQVAAVADPDVAAMVRHHHESFDGSGFPDGLTGDEIPLGARIIAVAETFDELVSAGPERAPASRRNALDTLSERAGSQLDPMVVAAFVGYYSGVRSIAGAAFAATAPQRLVRWVAATPAGIGSAGTPALIQGVCAAGTLALAGSCLSGLPALSPDRDGDRPAAQQADSATGSDGGGTGEAVASAEEKPGSGKGEDGKQGGSNGDGEAPVPGAGRQQDGSGGGGGGNAPATPPSSGGGSQPGGDGGSGGSTPPSPEPSTPTSPVEVPDLPAPDLPVDPTSEIVDPVLDGLGEALPPAKPLTDTLKGVVGGLTGGLTGGGSAP